MNWTWGCNFRRFLQQTALLRGPHQRRAVPCDCSQWLLHAFASFFLTVFAAFFATFLLEKIRFNAWESSLDILDPFDSNVFSQLFLVDSHNGGFLSFFSVGEKSWWTWAFALPAVWPLCQSGREGKGRLWRYPWKASKTPSPACIQKTSPFQMQI